MTRRKSSLKVSLVLIGAVALSGCGDESRQRDVYASLDDCVRDWNSRERCEQQPTSRSGSGGHAGSWLGPSYAGTTRADGTPRPSSHAVSAMHVSRGGFGSSAGFHSAGG